MTTHYMRLRPAPFSWIADGNKTVEARLYDEKRQKTQLGDTIIFRQTDDESRMIEAKVIGLLRYETFGDMFAHNDIKKFGGEDPESMAEGMLQYYSQQKQDEHGVIGIEFSVVL
jgi:ASC-1-like (ASCH) protein